MMGTRQPQERLFSCQVNLERRGLSLPAILAPPRPAATLKH